MFDRDIIEELRPLQHLNWARARRSSGTAGSYLKAYGESGGRKLYYKLSCYDSVHGITGHECVNELIVDRLLTVLGVEHLHYQLVHAMVEVEGQEMETWLCASEDFKEAGDSKIALDDYYDLRKQPGESVQEFCRRSGWGAYIARMLAVDYLILNRDRHGANVEVLRNSRTRTVRLAPLFDHGLSLLYSCRGAEDVERFDPMADLPVQSYVGGRSAWENLALARELTGGELPVFRALEERDRPELFRGLDRVLQPELQDKIWAMIWGRWYAYEELRDRG